MGVSKENAYKRFIGFSLRRDTASGLVCGLRAWVMIAASQAWSSASKARVRIESLGDDCGFNDKELALWARVRIESLGEKWYQ